MSVSAFISNPKNESEKRVYIPVATEKRFQNDWMPIIEELGLKWAICFQSGIEIEKEDLEPVLNDLKQIKDWVIRNMENEDGNLMITRLDNLSENLVELFKEEDRLIYIG